MAILGRRQPFKPIIKTAGAQPSANKLILKGAAIGLESQRPSTRTQSINHFKGAQTSQAKLTIKSQVVQQAARRLRFKTQIKNAFAYYVPIPPPIPSRLILRLAILPRMAFRPATKTKIINSAIYPPAPTPPRPVIKTKNQPFVQRDPTQLQPLRRFTEIVAIIFNSLFGQGILVQTGPESFTLAGGAGGVLSFNGRAGIVTFEITDLPLSPVIPGNYTFPMMSVDQYGRVTFAASQNPSSSLSFVGPTINGSGPSPITLVILNGSISLGKLAPIAAGRFLANNQTFSSSPFAVPITGVSNSSGLTFVAGALTGPQTTIANANGISGTVDLTDASNPVFTLFLGAITPSSVAASGTVTGSNLSGTNTGDQTIILTGNVTGSGTGSFVATISGHAVTYAKMQQASASTLLGNSTGGAHDIQEITLGAGLSFSGTTLVASGGSGTVTSVGLSLPGQFTITVSPITTSGTLTATLPAPMILADGSQAFTADQSAGTHKFTNVVDPVNPQDAATKNYVDTQIALLTIKQECQAATAVALAASTYNNVATPPSGVGATLTLNVAAVLVLDGYTPALNDRILVKNQASALQNGIYVLTTVGTVLINAVLTRTLDFDQPTDGINGAFVFIQNGTINAKTGWLCNTFGSITFGTTAINWTQDTGSGTYTGTSPVTVSASNVISVAVFVASGASHASGLVPDPGAGAGTTKFLREDATFAVPPGSLSVVRGYIDGCVLAQDITNPLTVLVVGSGTCANSTTTFMFTFTQMGKDITATWAAGSGNGGLFPTLTLAANTWYHVFIIRKSSDGSLDAGFDTDVTASHIPPGYSEFRRLGSVLTDGSKNILPFHQYGDEFWWDTSVYDFGIVGSGAKVSGVNPGTSAVSIALTVPPNVKVRAVFHGYYYNSTPGNTQEWYASSLDSVDLAVNFSTCIESAPFMPSNSESHGGTMQVWTNTSSQIRGRAAASGANYSLNIRTLGWYDQRGKNS